MAAVNDITARDEQFQQFLNTSKSTPDNTIGYYTENHLPSAIYTQPTTKNADCTKELSKSLTSETLSNELFQNNCDLATDEYVDINDMEFIKKSSDSDQTVENILMRRPRRKKTTKREDEACMWNDKTTLLTIFFIDNYLINFLINVIFSVLVADKIVPSRALATLPTSYLYFDTSNESTESGKLLVAQKTKQMKNKKATNFNCILSHCEQK